ncbi:MAG: malonyl-CoA decarboxylase, partial [Polaromonas sp. 39-63-203]
MNPADWLGRGVKRADAAKKVSKEAEAPVNAARAASEIIAKVALTTPAPASASTPVSAPPGGRSTRERLKATLRKKEEALSPRVLRRTLQELKAIVDPQVSEVEGGRRASGVAGWYASAALNERRDMWLLMSEEFVADPQKVRQAQAQYAAHVGTPDEAAAEVRFRRATVSPRRRL